MLTSISNNHKFYRKTMATFLLWFTDDSIPAWLLLVSVMYLVLFRTLEKLGCLEERIQIHRGQKFVFFTWVIINYVTDEEEIDMFTPYILDGKRSRKPDQNNENTVLNISMSFYDELEGYIGYEMPWS